MKRGDSWRAGRYILNLLVVCFFSAHAQNAPTLPQAAWETLDAEPAPTLLLGGCPAMTLDSRGKPVVTASAAAKIPRPGLVYEVDFLHAARWNVQNWADFPGFLNLNPLKQVSDLSVITDPEDYPIVAWTESEGAETKAKAAAPSVVIVKRWTGEKWQTLGDVFRGNNARDAFASSLAFDEQGPLLAWTEGERSTENGADAYIHIHRWNGDWQEVTTPLRGRRPKLAVGSGALYVAYETVGAHVGAVVTRWDGERWRPLENIINSTVGVNMTLEPGSLSLSLSDGNPVTAWKAVDAATGAASIVVQQWNGEAWGTLGGVQKDDQRVPDKLMLASRNSVILLAFTAYPDPITASLEPKLYVTRWAGEWRNLGSLDTLASNVACFALAQNEEGTPVVAWRDAGTAGMFAKVSVARFSGLLR